MKKRLSKLALLAVAAAFVLVGFPACGDDDDGGEPPAEASATFAGVEIPEGGLALTAGTPQDVTATLTVANTAFGDAVKALEVDADISEYITLTPGEKVSISDVKVTETANDTTMKITFTVAAEEGAESGSITATLKAAALTADKDVAATGTISYTVTAADPNAPKATFTGDNVPADGVALTTGEEKTGNATIAVTKGTFSDAVKALNVGDAIPDTLLALNAGGKVTVSNVKVATKATDTAIEITFTVTAGNEAGADAIKATLKADALKDYNKQVFASGSIAFTVKTPGGSEENNTVFTLTGATATINLGKTSIDKNGYLTYTAEMYNSSKQTFEEVEDNYPNISTTDRIVEISVKNVASFKVYVKNSTANRKFNITVGNGEAITAYHPASVDGSDIVPFAFNTGTTEETKISIGGAGDGSVYPGYIVLSDTEETIGVKSVKITGVPESSVALADNSMTVTAIALKDNYTETAVTWASSDESIATVANGTITFHAAGKTTISATAGDKSDSFELEVVDGDIAVTGVTLNSTKTFVKIGETKTLKATVEPTNATNTAVSWTSSDSAIATVSDEGVVTAVAKGTTTITATTTDGGKTATCAVTVYEGSATGTSYTELFKKYKVTGDEDFKDFAKLTCVATTYTFENDVSLAASTNDKFSINSLSAGENNFAIDVSNRLELNKAASNATASVVSVPVAGTCKVTVLWYNNGSTDRGIYVTSTNAGLVGVEGPDEFTNGVGEDNKTAWSTCASQAKANNTSVFTYVSDTSSDDTLKITNSTAAGKAGGGGIYIYGIIVEY